MGDDEPLLTDEPIDFLFGPGPVEKKLHVLVNMIYSDLHNFEDALYWGEVDGEEAG